MDLFEVLAWIVYTPFWVLDWLEAHMRKKERKRDEIPT